MQSIPLVNQAAGTSAHSPNAAARKDQNNRDRVPAPHRIAEGNSARQKEQNEVADIAVCYQDGT